ncbi:WD40-repeat-containing domain protein [Tribonema minus]|uniref:WD40-repeat-containing domain protein n=1 Tax=Tribonema minus TaxID=303371 RepID=A0A835YTZ5_9STRA|nr:WD40-repeat-containing domain protein [Tribonema minus]
MATLRLGGRRLLITGDEHGGVSCLALDGGEVTDLVLLPGVRGFATGGEDRVIHYVQLRDGGELERTDAMLLHGHAGSITSLAALAVGSGCGSVLLSASADSTMRLWDVRAGAKDVLRIQVGAAGAASAVFHPADAHLVVCAPASGDAMLQVWDLRRVQGYGGAIATTLCDSDTLTGGGGSSHASSCGSANGRSPPGAAGAGGAFRTPHGGVKRRSIWDGDTPDAGAGGGRGWGGGESLWAGLEDVLSPDCKDGGVAGGVRVTTPKTPSARSGPSAEVSDPRPACLHGHNGKVWVKDARAAAQGPAAGACCKCVRMRRNARHLEFTPDGRHLVTASDDGVVRVWDGSAATLACRGAAAAVAPVQRIWCPSASAQCRPLLLPRRVLLGCDDGTVRSYPLLSFATDYALDSAAPAYGQDASGATEARQQLGSRRATRAHHHHALAALVSAAGGDVLASADVSGQVAVLRATDARRAGLRATAT